MDTNFEKNLFKFLPFFSILVIVSLYLFLMTFLVSKECTTQECFFAAANSCQSSTLEQTQKVGTFFYTSSRDCYFTKTFLEVNESETQEMKNLLEGASTVCPYEPGSFNPVWVSSLLQDQEQCEGDLKDTLQLLEVFVY